jgi:signal transduction histidine kinase
LTSLSGNVDFLTLRCLEDCPLPAVNQHQEVLRDLSSETRRMTHMVNDLLLLARADAQQHLTLMPIELEPLLQTAFRQARSLSDKVRVQLVSRCAGIQVMADPDRLLQLLLILLDNAVRYTPPGGEVALRAYSDARDDQPGVRVEVSDTGPGIPVEERSRIFDRFYRSQATRAAEGAGLGLAVARWIAQEHDTDILVSDNAPLGSMFEFWLPALPGVHA